MKKITSLFLALIAVACLFSLSGCGESGDIPENQVTPSENGYSIETPSSGVDLSGWDNRFVDRLHLTECNLDSLIGGLQNVDVTAEYDEVQLHIGQTVGDGQLLYIALDMTLPMYDDVADHVEGAFLNGGLPISPGVVGFVPGELQEKELTPQKLKEYRMMTSRASLQLSDIDPESKTFHFLIEVSSIDYNDLEKRWDYTGEQCSLLLGDIAIGEEVVLTGPFVLTWTAENDLPTWSQELHDNAEETLGTVVLTPLYMDLKWFDKDSVSEGTTVEIDAGDETIVLLEEFHTIGHWDVPLAPPIPIIDANVFRIGSIEFDISL